MFSKASVLSFSDPASEKWFTSIEEIVSNNTLGLTSSEVKEATRISADLSSIVTTVVPLSRVSLRCEDTILLKTMIVPHIKFNSRLNFKLNNGLLQRSHSNESTYTLLSQDSIFSKATKMFGQQVHVIGRTCKVDKSINSSSIPTGNLLFENYIFHFDGEITLTENCPHNGSIVSKQWTFNSTAQIILPLVCSLNSTKINSLLFSVFIFFLSIITRKIFSKFTKCITCS